MFAPKSVPSFERSLRSCSTSLRFSGGSSSPGPPIIPQCFLEQLRVFAAQLRLRLFEGLDRLVDVLAVIDAHPPILEKFHRVLGGRAHGLGLCSFP